MNEQRPYITAMATVVLGVTLAGCVASNNLVRQCCYEGDAALTHLYDTRLTLDDGSTVAFGEIFAGFRADPAPIARIFPFDKADIGLVTLTSLRDLLPTYDANADRILQEPELTVLYVQEAARGLGYPVVRVEPSGANGAIATSRADVSALVSFVDRHAHEMAPQQQKLFRELYWLGLEVERLPHFYEVNEAF